MRKIFPQLPAVLSLGIDCQIVQRVLLREVPLLRGFFDTLPGAHLSFTDTPFSCFLLMAPFCFLLGAQYVLLSRVWREITKTQDTSGATKRYIFESAGRIIGGFIFTLFLVHHLNLFECAFLVGMLMLVGIGWLSFGREVGGGRSPTGLRLTLFGRPDHNSREPSVRLTNSPRLMCMVRNSVSSTDTTFCYEKLTPHRPRSKFLFPSILQTSTASALRHFLLSSFHESVTTTSGAGAKSRFAVFQRAHRGLRRFTPAHRDQGLGKHRNRREPASGNSRL